MKAFQSIPDNLVDLKVKIIDENFQQNFRLNIIEVKKLTHLCQYECYKGINDLNKAENCARNCFAPMLSIKKNTSKLIENCREDLEKCKFNASSNNNDGKYNAIKIKRCLQVYEKDLLNTKDEAEYIYNGYIKNFPDFINFQV